MYENYKVKWKEKIEIIERRLGEIDEETVQKVEGLVLSTVIGVFLAFAWTKIFAYFWSLSVAILLVDQDWEEIRECYYQSQVGPVFAVTLMFGLLYHKLLHKLVQWQTKGPAKASTPLNRGKSKDSIHSGPKG